MHMQPDTGKCTCELTCSTPCMEARHGVERVNSHVHLPVSSACALYDAPEDGCVLHVYSRVWLQLEARHGVERVNSRVHLPVSSACALYDAPEDGCVLHPKHVE